MGRSAGGRDLQPPGRGRRLSQILFLCRLLFELLPYLQTILPPLLAVERRYVYL